MKKERLMLVLTKFSKGLSEAFIKSYKDQIPPWGPMGYFIYKRTYARMMDTGYSEEWYQTCARVCNGLIDLNGRFTNDEIEYLYDVIFNLKGCVAGRALWQLGTETVEKIGADSLMNCWHRTINDLDAFLFLFSQLMLGGGVGFNILPQNVYELPPVQFSPVIERVENFDCDFIVPDNREGWVELLSRIFDSFFYSGKPLRYNTHAIRAAGKRIIGFGGTACGSEPLVAGMKNIVRVLRKRHTLKLRPIDCMDIANIIGQIVVAGNVRRSSEIALGDPHDFSFLSAKDWTTHDIPEWRTMSNNSVLVDDIHDLLPQFWQAGYETEGEPYGLVNLKNCRRFGRLNDKENYRPDPLVQGVNPCAEISLGNGEPCCLAEIFLPNLNDENEFHNVLNVIYKATKTIVNLPFAYPETNEIVQLNRRIGIGITGYMQTRKFQDVEILNRGYQYLEGLDKSYSRDLGINRSVKLTTLKPSGTLSLLPGVTPGMHAAIAKYMFRTVRISANHPLVKICRDHGYKVEPKLNLDSSHDTSTMIIYFPIKTPEEAVLADDITVVDELETQKRLQTYWSDNAVSATHYFKESDVPQIREWLKNNYTDSVKTTSFLRHHDHGFAQAPYIPITEEEYNKSNSHIKPIIDAKIQDEWIDYDDQLECSSGMCPVK